MGNPDLINTPPGCPAQPRTADRFLAPSLRDSDLLRPRARTLAAALLLALALSVVGQLPLALLETPLDASRGHLALGLFSLALSGLLWQLKRCDTLAMTGNLTVLLLGAGVTVAYLASLPIPGAPSALVLGAMLGLPPLAFLSAGRRAGVVWTATLGLAHLALGHYPALMAGYPLADQLPSALVLALAYGLVAAIGAVYEQGRQHLERRLLESCPPPDVPTLLDTLTGLHNRSGFDRALDAAISHAQRCGEQLALVYIDLDQFTPINQRYGHIVGDSVLRTVALRLAGAVRGSDICARLSGDKFAVIMRGQQQLENAHTSAEKIYHAICQPIPLAGASIDLGASIGVTLCPAHSTDTETLWLYATMAMRAAKAGGSRVRLFHPDIDLEP